MRLYHTIRHLRAAQVYYRLYYKLKRAYYKTPGTPEKAIEAALSFPTIPFSQTDTHNNYNPSNNTFSFVNLRHSFGTEIDWNYAGLGKLWVYNLNYFDWLNDESITINNRLETIDNYFFKSNKLKDGTEPYPSSLRGVNWISFLSRHAIKNRPAITHLYETYHRLAAFTEYHIQANHLLENGFSLFFGAHYFNNTAWYSKAKHILTGQLPEQILNDGAHYETSPMYHCILLQRLLLCIQLARHSDRFREAGLLALMEEKAAKMLGWLQALLLDNGQYPMVGDAAPGIAPAPASLFTQAAALGILYQPSVLSDCGLRKIKLSDYELLLDIADIMPSYQPGHTHADTLQFHLYRKGEPIITDTGISTYEAGSKRDQERSTAAHNTVVIDNRNSSDIWSRFRVGRRAKVLYRQEDANSITAAHDGYKTQGIIHERRFSWDNQKIIIEDKLKGYDGQNALLYLHFHPNVDLRHVNEYHFEAGGIHIKADGATGCVMETYQYCAGFNNTLPAQVLILSIGQHTRLSIEL